MAVNAVRGLNKFVLLAGLPRTGSTVLANALAQNDRFHIEGNSGLCQLMWDAQQSCNEKCVEQLTANNKLHSVRNMLVGGLPDLYYKGVSNKIILDKCRPWVMPDNMKMAQEYIAKDIKAIVMVRPIDEIVKSFAKLSFASGGDDSIYQNLMQEDSEVLMRSFCATYLSVENAMDNLLFISYKNIVDNLSDVISKVYTFIEEDEFPHKTTYINQTIKENDSVYALPNMHKIRNKVSQVKNEIILPDWVQDKCDLMTKVLFEKFKNYGLVV
jgi:sulfotransferase